MSSLSRSITNVIAMTASAQFSEKTTDSKPREATSPSKGHYAFPELSRESAVWRAIGSTVTATERFLINTLADFRRNRAHLSRACPFELAAAVIILCLLPKVSTSCPDLGGYKGLFQGAGTIRTRLR